MYKSSITNNQRDSFTGSSGLEQEGFPMLATSLSKYLLKLSEEGPLEKRLLCLLLHRQLHKLSAALGFDAHAGKTTSADAAKDYVQRARQ